MNSKFDDNYSEITEEAATWLVELQENENQSERATITQNQAFMQWLQRSPIHVREFLAVSSMWHELGMLDEKQYRQIEQQLVIEQQDNVTKLSTDYQHSQVVKANKTPAKLTWVMSLAASVLFVLWLSFFQTSSYQIESHSTLVGQQKQLILDDASQVNLNTATKLAVKFTEKVRAIELSQGEALFSVRKNNQRPFVVDATEAKIQVVGTEFNVKKFTANNTNKVEVFVVEGIVRVKSNYSDEEITLTQGQVAIVSAQAVDGRYIHVYDKGQSPVAWLEGKIVFNAQPLDEVVAEFNRYSHQKIVVNSEQLTNVVITGVFATADSQALIDYLSEIKNIQVELAPNGDKVISLNK
ncbi:FecR family protein [Catenovulum agarivorans]|uniref:FecR family protein n=1 Tax=Catenovulum agarivorans TaxID=1172192 RepID=UPI0003139849|nr:FecR domain-containing protein [Catenovulum agarivorans]